jgi:peptide-methionine (R)-S-oxide reductase
MKVMGSIMKMKFITGRFRINLNKKLIRILKDSFIMALVFIMFVKKSLAEWKKLLSPERFHVLRESGTEPPFTNAYWKVNEEGEYNCAGCGSLLFKSDDKFFSQCGWPAFSRPATQQLVLIEDNSLGVQRIEVRCGACDGHLGHVFDDGPGPLKTRYCINSASLNFNKF